MNQQKFLATTTVELVQQAGHCVLYNNRRIRRIDNRADIALLFDTLCREGVQVEDWLPKATVHGKACDLRVLMIAGQPQHTIVRLSKTPITNLHLLNERCDVNEVILRVDPMRWNTAMNDCRRVAAVFPNCLHVGVDVAFTPGFRQHRILEANAFGDLLPGLLFNGQDTYSAQLAALEAMS